MNNQKKIDLTNPQTRKLMEETFEKWWCGECNASECGKQFGVSEKTWRRYADQYTIENQEFRAKMLGMAKRGLDLEYLEPRDRK